MSRLTFSADSLASQQTNIRAALGRIEDVDIAEESANLAKYSILPQAAAALRDKLRIFLFLVITDHQLETEVARVLAVSVVTAVGGEARFQFGAGSIRVQGSRLVRFQVQPQQLDQVGDGLKKSEGTPPVGPESVVEPAEQAPLRPDEYRRAQQDCVDQDEHDDQTGDDVG